MAKSVWKWIGAGLIVLVLVLQLTAPSTASPMKRYDNGNNNNYYYRNSLNEVAPSYNARRVPRYVQPNGIFEFFGALNSIKGIVNDVS